MIIVMKPSATKEDIDALVEAVKTAKEEYLNAYFI